MSSNKKRKKLEQLIKEQELKDEQERQEMDQRNKDSRRPSMCRQSTSSLLKSKDVPKSMVTYEKGPPRDYGPKKEIDTREHGLGHAT